MDFISDDNIQSPDDLLNELTNTPVQPYVSTGKFQNHDPSPQKEEPVKPVDDDFGGIPPSFDEEEPTEPPKSEKGAEQDQPPPEPETNTDHLDFTAGAFMKGIDLLGSLLLSLWAEDSSPESYAATEKEFNDGKQAIYTYLLTSESKIKMSPLEAMLMVFLFIYGPKTYNAYQSKKKDNKNSRKGPFKARDRESAPPPGPEAYKSDPVEVYEMPKEGDEAILLPKEQTPKSATSPGPTSEAPEGADEWSWIASGEPNPMTAEKFEKVKSKKHSICPVCKFNPMPTGRKVCTTRCGSVKGRRSRKYNQRNG